MNHLQQHHQQQHSLKRALPFASRLLQTGTLLALSYSLGLVDSFTGNAPSSSSSLASSSSLESARLNHHHQVTLNRSTIPALLLSPSSPFSSSLSSSLSASSPSSQASSSAQIWSLLCSTYGHTQQQQQQVKSQKRRSVIPPLRSQSEGESSDSGRPPTSLLSEPAQRPLYAYLLSQGPRYLSDDASSLVTSSPSPAPSSALVEVSSSSRSSVTESPPVQPTGAALYYNYYAQDRNNRENSINQGSNEQEEQQQERGAEPAEPSQRLKRQSVTANTPWDLIK